MKTIFLSLLLSFPAHANKIYSNQECLQMYQAIALDFETSKVLPTGMMSYYTKMCMASNKDYPEHTTLIKAVISDGLVVAIKAKLAEQDLIKL